MINLDDIAALPHGEGKAVALSLWKRLQIVDKAFRMMAAEFDYSELKGDRMYRAYIEFAEDKARTETHDEVVTRLEAGGTKS
jgi:hypothetical protein